MSRNGILREKEYVLWKKVDVYAVGKEDEGPDGHEIVSSDDRYYNRGCAQNAADLLTCDTPLFREIKSKPDFSPHALDDQLFEAAQKIPDVSDILKNTREKSLEQYEKMVGKRSSEDIERGSSFYNGDSNKVVESIERASWRVEEYNQNKGVVKLKSDELSGIYGTVDVEQVDENELIYPVDKNNTGEITFLLPITDKQSMKEAHGSTLVVDVKDPKTGEVDFNKATCIDFFPGEPRFNAAPDTIQNNKDVNCFGFPYRVKVNEPMSVKEFKDRFSYVSHAPHFVSILQLVDQKQLEHYMGKNIFEKTYNDCDKKPDVANGLNKISTSILLRGQEKSPNLDKISREVY